MAAEPSVPARDTSRYEIAVVANALAVMTDLGVYGPSSLSDLAERTGLSNSALYRLLVTLETYHFALRDRARREWSLGPAFFHVRQSAQPHSLRFLAMPSLVRLHERFEETINLALLRDGQLIYTEILQSPQPLAARETPGDEAPLATTALGRAVLAALPDSDPLATAVLLDSPDPHALKSELAAVRERGWATEQGETVPGVACLGAAILDLSGLPVGGISVSLPDVRLSPSRSLEMGYAVRLEAQRVSAALAGNSK